MSLLVYKIYVEVDDPEGDDDWTDEEFGNLTAMVRDYLDTIPGLVEIELVDIQ